MTIFKKDNETAKWVDLLLLITLITSIISLTKEIGFDSMIGNIFMMALIGLASVILTVRIFIETLSMAGVACLDSTDDEHSKADITGINTGYIAEESHRLAG